MKVEIKGAIVSNDDKEIYDWIGLESVCPNDVRKKLDEAEDNEKITAVVNSGGGDVFAATEIYALLQERKANVEIVGLAASAASVIAMAGYCTMTPSAMMMIHNASSSASGDYRAMDKQSEVLKQVNKAIASSYRAKTGMSEGELLNMMNEERWLTAAECLKYGFADEIALESTYILTASGGGVIGNEAMKRMRGMLAAEREKPKEKERLKMRLELTRTKRRTENNCI